MDIHNYKRRFERILERIQQMQLNSDKNKQIMFDFKDYLLSENIGICKIERYLNDLIKYDRLLRKSFDIATTEDIRRVIGEINQSKLSEYSKKDFKVLIRKLYRFIEGIQEKDVFPDKVKWISIKITCFG